jgi:pimeloyl-ACP methyl ester carboxylesterase
LNAQDLFFEQYGQGLPVVLLHGYPLDHTIWKPVVNGLKEHARVIVPDLRGHGASFVPEGDWSIRDMAEDVRLLLDRLEIGRAVVVGHSMGGYVTLSFAHAYPQRVAGLGLLASQAAADTTERRQARYIQIEEARRRGVRAVTDGMATKLTGRPALAEALKLLMAKMSLQGLMGALKSMAERPDATPWLGDMDVPAVVIAGLADSIIPLERSQTMAQLLPRGWLVQLSDAGHMPMLEASDLVCDALRQLLEACSTNTAGQG